MSANKDDSEYNIDFRELRDCLGWTQPRFADYIGVKVGHYQKWEYGNSVMPKYARKLLIKALKYDEYLKKIGLNHQNNTGLWPLARALCCAKNV